MNRSSNADMADIHMAYGSANGNARMAVRLHEERLLYLYLPGNRIFISFHRQLLDSGSLSANKMAAGRLGRFRIENEKILQHFRENP